MLPMQAQGNPRTQRAVLGLVLYEHPDALSADALVREVGAGATQAAGELVAAGLLWRDGEAVRATPAAVHFDRLELS
jgi:hypothetical protein